MALSVISRRAAWLAPAVLAISVFSQAAVAADMAPDAMVEKLAGETLATIKKDPALQRGDVQKINALVDSKVMPHVNFEKLVREAVGRNGWRAATPEQQQRLQREFKTLLTTTYAGAFKMATKKELKMLPMRGEVGNDVIVRTQLVDVGGGNPASIDYRLEKTPGNGLGWKAYNMSIGGVWTISSYQKEFEPILRQGGIDGLIQFLANKNKANAGK